MIKLKHFAESFSMLIYYNYRHSNVSNTASFIIRSRTFHTEYPKKSQEDVKNQQNDPFMDLKGEWPSEELIHFKTDMKLLPDFISQLEENQLFEEVEPYMTRLRYEFDHWDDAIHGFRETERKHWYPHNRAVLERVSKVGFEGKIMSYIHILDLAPEGVIKPHIDSTRYCGHTIAGLSLLSDAVMRMVRAKVLGHNENSEKPEDDGNYRSQPKAVLENNFYADIFLPRRSLYIMSHTARYNFTHEILSNAESKFRGQTLTKDRRISIICRNDP